MNEQLSLDHGLPPLVSLCIPPVLKAEAEAIAAQDPPVHPAWTKLQQHGGHFVVRTNAIEDIEEVADWAQSWLIEPEYPLDKSTRQAFQNVIERAGRYVHLSPIGSSHYLATGWKKR